MKQSWSAPRSRDFRARVTIFVKIVAGGRDVDAIIETVSAEYRVLFFSLQAEVEA